MQKELSESRAVQINNAGIGTSLLYIFENQLVMFVNFTKVQETSTFKILVS